MIDQATIEEFKANLRGQLIQPGDEGYDEACKIYNAMIERRPGLISRCADVADVMAAINIARENDLLVAIRGGGHNGPGVGTCDDGRGIDMSAIKYTRVDPQASTVQVGGGCTWGDVDHATHAFGLATPSGSVSTSGVGGLTLGGGHGYLTRKYGLTIDNLLSADMVVADVIPNPPRTNFVKDAEARGCKVLDGLGMLVNQGITGIEYWTGVTVDGIVMRTRLEELFGA